MRVLVDTHALIWFCEGNAALSAGARAAMEEGTNERFVSHATAWEMAIKHALGKLRLQGAFDQIFPGSRSYRATRISLPTMCRCSGKPFR
jgi:PIN domain nuclease of toxin-antitoxin system